MNSEIIALTFKGLLRRFKSVLRSMAIIVLAFTFVTGVLLLQENMKSWQIASIKNILATGLLYTELSSQRKMTA